VWKASVSKMEVHLSDASCYGLVKSLGVEVRGDDMVGHAGNVIPRMLADATGLTSGMSAVLSRPEVLHDRGAVLRDVASQRSVRVVSRRGGKLGPGCGELVVEPGATARHAASPPCLEPRNQDHRASSARSLAGALALG
jgi:hypothetical protein